MNILKLNLLLQNKYVGFILVLISGVLTGIALLQMNPWLIWFSLIPLLLIIPNHSIKRSILYGGFFGLIVGSILLSWIFETTSRYAGTETLLGIPIFIVICIYYSIYPLIFSVLYSLLLKKKSIRSSSILTTVLIGAILWVILEWVRINIFISMPWVIHTVAISQLKSLYGIQLVSITGQWGISFLIVMVNLLFALAIKHSKLKYGIYALAIVVLFYFSGFVIFNMFDSSAGKKIKVAILQENLKAHIRWNESNGDRLAQELIDLNYEAANYNPDLIVWSETVIPWPYLPNDDLINIAVDITKKSNPEHIIGILTKVETDTTKLYNSAYLINSDGVAVSRYDKVNLLSFLERPFLSKDLKVPFLSESNYTNLIQGSNHQPLKGRYANMGVMICNESISPDEAKRALKRGANLLITISNDAWVEGTHLIDIHFYASRLRAVESGKDIIINSNCGIGGIISGNGIIQVQNSSQYPVCITGEARIRNYSTLYSNFGDWFIYLSMLILLILVFKRIKQGKI